MQCAVSKCPSVRSVRESAITRKSGIKQFKVERAYLFDDAPQIDLKITCFARTKSQRNDFLFLIEIWQGSGQYFSILFI
jgi:hypothetical protein